MTITYNPKSKGFDITWKKTDHKTDHRTDYNEEVYRPVTVRKCKSRRYRGKKCWNETHMEYDKDTSEKNKRLNADNRKLNEDSIRLNEENTKTNDGYRETERVATITRGSDYVPQRQNLRTHNSDAASKAEYEKAFRDFYVDQKLQRWNTDLGAKPLYGEFDGDYYASEQSPDAEEQWYQALANDDVDIVERYSNNPNVYYLQHYTNIGRPANKRGNRAEVTESANRYIEFKPTDADLQDVRSLQLGINTDTQTERVLNIPEVREEWEKAKRDDPYWKELGKEKFLDVSKPDEFVALFRLSDRDQDKNIQMNFNVNTGYGITELEDALNEAAGSKATVDVKRFGALTQNVLKDTIEEMKKAKQQEEFISTVGGFAGFNEIMDMNKTLTNSILGDSGVGGILSWTSGGKAEESLEKSLEKITGVNNNVTYNWQQWFDTKLKEKYDDAIELGYTTDEAEEQIRIDGEFANQFITDYLQPRFDESRSMDEFIEYLDVRQEEQNPFQTQDLLNAVKQTAQLNADSYLDQLRAETDRRFDSDFYFDPTGNIARGENWTEGANQASYAAQKEMVNQDWEDAKNGDSYWAQQAYRFGVDINDKDAFARMHFEVKGQGQGFDAAEDILNAGKVKNHIYENILPNLEDEALKQGSVFGQFVTPEEFADDMLEGIDPGNREQWNSVLEQYGLENFQGSFDELKEYIMETLRTGSAQVIRENIKYLNEKRKKPTQKVLGITYIQRDEDYKDEKPKAETELYKTFQNAGFQGTEDEFYDDFFPDLNRSEQVLLTKGGKDDALKTWGLDMRDPFASLGTIESFFGEEEDDDDYAETEEERENREKSYFNADLTEDDSWSYKSKKKEKDPFGEFTHLFKGL